MKIPPAKIYFSEQQREKILKRIDECLSSGQLTMGKYGKQFEEEFARYLDIKYAISVNSGTSAIEIPLRILGITGKEVLVPSNTFFATPAAVFHAGGKVKFIDTDPNTFSINVKDLKRKISKDTAGVIVVHIGGIITPQIGEIADICKDNDLFLFEDAAHALGCSLNGRMAGTFGIAASFSFYPTKVISSAEGGMIITNNEDIKNEAMMYRDQGKAGFTMNIHDKLGNNWRLSEPHAIIGLHHFKKLDYFIQERLKIAKVYDKELKSIPRIYSLSIPNGCKSNYYKYIALLEEGIDRQQLKRRLKEEFEIGLSGEVYELPCHLQPIFKQGHTEGDLPIAEDICKRHVCLPIFPGMKTEEAEYVLESLNKVIRQL